MKTKKQKIILIATIGIVLVTCGVIFAIKHFSDSSNTNSTPTTASESTKGEPAKSSSDSSTTSSTTQNEDGVVDKNGDASTNQTTTLTIPTGTFISNHRVSLSDSNQVNVQSDCTTTSGATCKITFTNGSVTKSLDVKTTDAGGAAYWSWNVKDLGLTAGSWQVKAVATLGNQTKTAADAMNLEIN